MEFNNIHSLAKVKEYMDCLVKEAIDIQLHPNKTRDNGVMLSNTWQPLLLQYQHSRSQ
jgi:hypothetical protein